MSAMQYSVLCIVICFEYEECVFIEIEMILTFEHAPS